MSLSARRLSGTVTVERFKWHGSAGIERPTSQPSPVLFMQSVRGPGSIDSSVDIEARELQLPTVSAERIDTIERDAFARGYARGESAAEADTASRVTAALERLQGTITEVSGLRPMLMRRAEHELVRLAIAMAERLVRRELAVDPDLLLVIARVAIDRLGEQAAATVHLHPADHAVLARTEGAASLALVADVAIARGGCLIKSAVGMVDAGISGQIAELARELLGGDTGEEIADGVGTHA